MTRRKLTEDELHSLDILYHDLGYTLKQLALHFTTTESHLEQILEEEDQKWY